MDLHQSAIYDGGAMARKTNRKSGESSSGSVHIRPDIATAWSRWCKDRNAKNNQTVQRIIEWFMIQPAAVREAIIQYEHPAPEAIAEMLEDLALRVRKGELPYDVAELQRIIALYNPPDRGIQDEFIWSGRHSGRVKP